MRTATDNETLDNLLERLERGGATVSKVGGVRKDPAKILADERARKQIEAFGRLVNVGKPRNV